MRKLFTILSAALFSVSLLASQKIYFKADQGYWNYLDGGVRSATAIYAWEDETIKNAEWPGVRMTKVAGEEFLWEAEIADNFKNVIFVRVNPEGAFTEQGLKTKDLEIPTDGKNLYTLGLAEIKDWNDPDLWSEGIQEGEWSVYGDVPPTPENLPVVALAGAFNGWSETANILTPAEDSLTASVKIQLKAEDYEFKLVVGDAWLAKDTIWDVTRENPSVAAVNQAIPMGPNLKLIADVAGEYIFTWTYADSSLVVTFPSKDVPPTPEELPVVVLAGAFNGWSETANILTPAEDSLTASVKIQLEAEDYEFKMVVGGEWLAKDTIWDVTRENPSVAAVDQAIPMGPNLKLIADVAGEYTFTWTYADNSLVVTFPDKDTPQETKYFMKNCWNGGEWTWKEMTKDGDNYKLKSVIYGGVGVNYNTIASDEHAEWVAEDAILGDKVTANDSVTFVLDPAAGTVTATKLNIEEGLDEQVMEGKAVKFIENGILYIEKNGLKYNAQGQVIK